MHAVYKKNIVAEGVSHVNVGMYIIIYELDIQPSITSIALFGIPIEYQVVNPPSRSLEATWISSQSWLFGWTLVLWRARWRIQPWQSWKLFKCMPFGTNTIFLIYMGSRWCIRIYHGSIFATWVYICVGLIYSCMGTQWCKLLFAAYCMYI